MSDALPLDWAGSSANPFQTLVEFAWQIYNEEAQRDLSPGWRGRWPMNEMATHARERETRLHQLRDAALGAALKIDLPFLEVEKRVVALEAACKNLLHWPRHVPTLTEEEQWQKEAMLDPTDNASAYLYQQLNLLVAAMEPVHRLAALYGGQTAPGRTDMELGMSDFFTAVGGNGLTIDFYPEHTDLLARFLTVDGHEDIYRHEKNTRIDDPPLPIYPPGACSTWLQPAHAPDAPIYAPGACSPWPPPVFAPGACLMWPRQFKSTDLPKPGPITRTIHTHILHRVPGKAEIVFAEDVPEMQRRMEAFPFAVLRAKCLTAQRFFRPVRKDKRVGPERTGTELWDEARRLVDHGLAAQPPRAPDHLPGQEAGKRAVDMMLAWCNEHDTPEPARQDGNTLSDMSTVSLPDYPELNNFRGRSLTEEQQAELLRLVDRLRPYHENRVRLADMTPEQQKEWLLLLKELGHDGEAEPSESWLDLDNGFYGAINLLHHLAGC